MTAASFYVSLSRYLSKRRLSYRAREGDTMEVSRMTESTLSRQLARARACEQRIERRQLLAKAGSRLGLMHSMSVGVGNLIGVRALLREEMRSIDVEFWNTQQEDLFGRLGVGDENGH